MANATAADTLTTAQVLRRSQQYDAELVFHANLSSLNARLLGSALNPCSSLTVLNLSKNRLGSLAGIQVVGPTLQYLDASENEIADIGALQACVVLRRVSLQANQLRDWAAVQPLASIPTLRELTLRAEIVLQGDSEPLVLDNPVCGKGTPDYVQKCRTILGQLEWLDGTLLDPAQSKPASSATDGAAQAKQQATSCNEAMRNANAELLKETSPNESTLQKLLSAAKAL